MTHVRHVVIILILSIASCSEPSDPLVGKWNLSDMDMGVTITEDRKAQYEEMMQLLRKSTFIILSEDGSAKSQTANPDGSLNKEAGTWQVSEDRKILSTTNNEGVVDSLNIISVNENRLVLTVMQGGQTLQMTYTKDASPPVD